MAHGLEPVAQPAGPGPEPADRRGFRDPVGRVARVADVAAAAGRRAAREDVMIRHLLKLAWRRRRANLLVATEIAGCFLVVAVIGSIAMHYLSRSRLPLGF